MASSIHTKEVQASTETLWSFLKEKGNWAVLIPGYLHHEFEPNGDMIWVFKGDFGIVQKAVKLKLHVVEEKENEKLAFDLEGLSDNINGSGYFEIKDGSTLEGSLTMKAGGFLAGMINPVLEKFVPETIETLTNAIAQNITKETV